MLKSHALASQEVYVKAWVFEVSRVFLDKLSLDDDAAWFKR